MSVKNLSIQYLKPSYLLFYILNAPLFALYNLMPFILYKDLQASAIQITTLIAIKPIVAVLSSYWSNHITSGPSSFKKNIIWVTALGIVPSLFFPLLNHNWLLIASFGLFFFAERAVIPAWMELIKVSFSESQQSRIVSRGSLVMFIAAAIVPVLVCPWLDKYDHSWRWVFPLLSCLSLIRLPILFRLPNTLGNKERVRFSEKPRRDFFLSPWVKTWRILKNRPDFAHYQLIFFLGGMGLMIMQPTLPHIIEDNLRLSYTEIATAVALCKGIGFALTNPLWSSRLHKTNIFKYCGLVTLFATGSIALILISKYMSSGIYMAFLLYGMMQAGSQLSWQLGGPIFSPKHDSSGYTSINVMLVGVRGCIGPLIGGLLYSWLGSTNTLVVGGVFCFLGSCMGYLGSKKIVLLQEV